MEIITDVAIMQQQAMALKKAGKSLGFVPTMGYLHEGHLKLVQQSVKQNQITVMSIFVNPLQFGPGEDFEAYPRDYDRDTALAEKAGVDLLFLPEHHDIFPNELSLAVKVNKRTNVLCGKSRPGHFDGVATILIKLFNLVMPDHVYFGLKDAQQVAVVDSLIADFNFPLTLHAVSTERDEDGVAKSSRNVYLSKKERIEAPHLYKSLKKAEQIIINGERNPQVIVQQIEAYLKKHTTGMIDYVEVLRFPDLTEMNELKGTMIIALAVKFSKARLIDNLLLDI